MAEPKTTVWELDPHTEAKHVLLRKYLNAWLPIITRHNDRVIFCDGFAGPGIYSNGKDGSPVIAIKALTEHSYLDRMNAEFIYLFIEEDQDRCKSLRGVIKTLNLPPKLNVSVINNAYDEAFTEVLDYLDNAKLSLAPTFAFIDPFGIKGLPLKTIARLMRHPKCEVFITFMLGYIYRFISTKEFEPHCDALFGTTKWREALTMEGPPKEQFLRQLYQNRLMDAKDGVGAKYTRYFTMKDEKKKTIYDLFFATNHAKGIDAMKDAMWAVDQGSGYTFSDATDPNQETLFSEEPKWDQLFTMLVAKFRGKEVSWAVVEEAIRHSPFRAMKTPLKAESKNAAGCFKIVRPSGSKGGALDYSCKLQFR